MASSDTRGVRHVKCPRCQSVLQEPGVPVYQCGGCGATLRAKNRSGESPSRSGLPPPQSRHLGSGDVATTSSRSSTPTPDATRSSRQQATAGTTSRRESGDLVSARRTDGSADVASTSSTPDATSNSRQHALGMTSRRESGDLVSATRHGSGDVASTSSTPDTTRRTRQHATTGTTSRCESGDLLSARKPRSGDFASTNSIPDTTSGRHQAGTDTATQRESSDLSSARNQVPLMERKEEHDPSTDRGVHHSSEFPRQRVTGDAEQRSASSPGISVSHNRGSRDATSEPQADAEKRSKSQVEIQLPDAARKKHSGDQAEVQPLQVRVREEPAPKPAQVAEPHPSRDAPAVVAGGKPPSPPRHDLQAEEEDLAPLRQKILKTVDELRGDLSELFRKSPDLNPTKSPPRLPNKQEGPASRGVAAATVLTARGARRHAAAAGADHHRAARAMKPGQVAAAAAAPPPPPRRGLPSRRYRRCRADPCFDDTAQQPRPCYHGCCRYSSKPECSSCRGHCCRPVTEPSPAPRMQPPPAAATSKRRPPPPRHHCRPVLKGAPFIICSTCFKLVQVPADFAVATNRLRKLRCGACATVLSYSYRDPARKKPVDELSTDGSDQVRGKGYDVADPFARFVDEFGLSSYSTTEDDERSPPLHVSRNTSLDTVDGAKAVAGRLHRLMGYGSASELLLRHSPDLYESFDERSRTTTPDYDRKGKGVCVDDDEDDDDSDDEDDSGVLKRSAARGAVWPLPGQGAIRIK